MPSILHKLINPQLAVCHRVLTQFVNSLSHVQDKDLDKHAIKLKIEILANNEHRETLIDPFNDIDVQNNIENILFNVYHHEQQTLYKQCYQPNDQTDKRFILVCQQLFDILIEYAIKKRSISKSTSNIQGHAVYDRYLDHDRIREEIIAEVREKENAYMKNYQRFLDDLLYDYYPRFRIFYNELLEHKTKTQEKELDFKSTQPLFTNLIPDKLFTIYELCQNIHPDVMALLNNIADNTLSIKYNYQADPVKNIFRNLAEQLMDENIIELLHKRNIDGEVIEQAKTWAKQILITDELKNKNIIHHLLVNILKCKTIGEIKNLDIENTSIEIKDSNQLLFQFAQQFSECNNSEYIFERAITKLPNDDFIFHNKYTLLFNLYRYIQHLQFKLSLDPNIRLTDDTNDKTYPAKLIFSVCNNLFTVFLTEISLRHQGLSSKSNNNLITISRKSDEADEISNLLKNRYQQFIEPNLKRRQLLETTYLSLRELYTVFTGRKNKLQIDYNLHSSKRLPSLSQLSTFTTFTDLDQVKQEHILTEKLSKLDGLLPLIESMMRKAIKLFDNSADGTIIAAKDIQSIYDTLREPMKNPKLVEALSEYDYYDKNETKANHVHKGKALIKKIEAFIKNSEPTKFGLFNPTNTVTDEDIQAIYNDISDKLTTEYSS